MRRRLILTMCTAALALLPISVATTTNSVAPATKSGGLPLITSTPFNTARPLHD